MPSYDIMEHLVRITPSIASLNPSQDTTSDQLASFYRPSAMPFVRHSPLPVAAQSASGAAGKSVSQTTSIRSILGVVRNQAQIAPSTLNQGLVPTILASSTTIINNLVFLCGTQTVSNLGAAATVVNPNNAIDGNLSTFAQVEVLTSSAANSSAQLTLAGVPSVSATAGLKLFIKSAIPTNNMTAGSITVSYSTDGGNSFTTVYTVGGGVTRAVTTDSIPLPSNFNLALLQVVTLVFRNSSLAQKAECDMYEAYIGT